MNKKIVHLIPFSDPAILTGENILNVVTFVPLGIYVEILSDRRIIGKQLFFFFLLTLIVEGF